MFPLMHPVFLLGYVDEVVHITALFFLDEVVKTKMMMASFGKTEKITCFCAIKYQVCF